MTVFEQAQRYLAAIPPSISGQGGHSQCLSAARSLVWGFNLSEAEAMQLLQEWNRSCQPPWSQAELDHKLREAMTKEFGKPRGYLLTGRESRSTWTPSAAAPAAAADTRASLPAAKIDLAGAQELKLPTPLHWGFEKVLRSCFRSGEGVRVMSAIDETTGQLGCNNSGGVVLSREEWLAKLEDAPNGINSLYYRLGGLPPGVYLGINPMKQGGRTDGDVTDYRHCLLEFDNLSLEEQWLIYTRSNLPCAAVIYSGKRSLHAWVKIHAKDRAEYNERVNLVYNHFSAYAPDPHNKNPSRFSRCPDAKRGEGWQLLLALDIGAGSFTEWSKELLVQGIGSTYSFKDTLKHDPDADGLTILGNHWLRKGGSCLLVGPSGIGKSSLGRQLAITWALGRPCFGIAPRRALKILMIQAENDKADMHDMDLGIARGLALLEDQAALDQLDRHLVTNHNVADTGHAFIIALQRLVDHHQPDLVIVDPLLSFIGSDISKQEVVGQFCRNWLNPILTASGVAFLAVHHTGKPPSENPGRGGRRKGPAMTLSEWAYKGIGSSELTNWARAICVLNPIAGGTLDGGFELLLAKRGKRAGATHPNGSATNRVLLEHSRQDVFWLQINPPEEVASATDSPVAPPPTPQLTVAGKVAKISGSNLHDFLAQIPPEGLRMKDLSPKLETYAANVLGIDINGTSVKRVIAALVENHKLAKNGKLYVKGPNA